MWAFLFLAGLFSGWWGALSSAAPPAPNLITSISSTLKNTPMTSRDVNNRATRNFPFALTIASPKHHGDNRQNRVNLETTLNHLEPYRYSAKRNLQDSSRSRRRATRQTDSADLELVRNLYRTDRDEEEDADGLKDASSMFRHDSLPRLRYGKDILDEDASRILEPSPEISASNLDSRIIPYALRSRGEESSGRVNEVGVLIEPRDPSPELYQDANLELDNFMNYQVTPTSLRNVGPDPIPETNTGESMHGDNANGEESVERERVINNYRITMENVRDYRRRHRINGGPVSSDIDDPRIGNNIDGRPESTALAMYPLVEEPNLAPNPYHTTQHSDISGEWEAASSSESAMERPRVTRAASTQNNETNRKRTKANSPREQRRQGRNKERRGQNWCPDADIGNRAFLAPTVFEGKARSMSSVRKPGSNYAVTFEVKQVYKSQPGFQPLLKNDSVRLHFRDKVPGKSTLCGSGSESSAGQDGQSGIVRANIKRGKVYLVFVSRVGPRNFTILGEPMIRSKKNAQAVQAVIRPDYVREVTLSELRDAVARLREKVKLVCRTRGSPPPRVHWLKDGVPLHPRRGLRIQHKRRRSKVVIASARAEDSGQYECVAESTSGHRAALAAELLVTRAPETTTAAWPRQEAPCPISEDFCMNGGTCLFFETVGEPACRCAEGFTGLRCENKDVTSTGSGYSRHRGPFSCKLGLSISYYC